MVRAVRSDDILELGNVLARALTDDPLWMALYPNPTRRVRLLTALFRAWLRVLHLHVATSWTTDDVSGAALWTPPDKWRIGILDQIRLAPRVASTMLGRVLVSLRVLSEIEAKHPKEPHHYLRLIGCDPSRQGEGIGARLIRPMLDVCDERREPAFLETANERNHSFYHRHGFQPIEVIDTSIGPRVWLMWREPR